MYISCRVNQEKKKMAQIISGLKKYNYSGDFKNHYKRIAQLYASKFNNSDEMNNFLDKFKGSKLTQ